MTVPTRDNKSTGPPNGGAGTNQPSYLSKLRDAKAGGIQTIPSASPSFGIKKSPVPLTIPQPTTAPPIPTPGSIKPGPASKTSPAGFALPFGSHEPLIPPSHATGAKLQFPQTLQQPTTTPPKLGFKMTVPTRDNKSTGPPNGGAGTNQPSYLSKLRDAKAGGIQTIPSASPSFGIKKSPVPLTIPQPTTAPPIPTPGSIKPGPASKTSPAGFALPFGSHEPLIPPSHATGAKLQFPQTLQQPTTTPPLKPLSPVTAASQKPPTPASLLPGEKARPVVPSTTPPTSLPIGNFNLPPAYVSKPPTTQAAVGGESTKPDTIFSTTGATDGIELSSVFKKLKELCLTEKNPAAMTSQRSSSSPNIQNKYDTSTLQNIDKLSGLVPQPSQRSSMVKQEQGKMQAENLFKLGTSDHQDDEQEMSIRMKRMFHQNNEERTTDVLFSTMFNSEKKPKSLKQKKKQKVVKKDMNNVHVMYRTTVRDFAQAAGIPILKLARAIVNLGLTTKGLKKQALGSILLNQESQELLCLQFNKVPVSPTESDLHSQQKAAQQADKDSAHLVRRNVDHGKTSVLDYMRKSNIAAREAGGITQSIGAFTVPALASGGSDTVFLDTPGHAAFHNMRARGCGLTDVAVLVVAADRGVQPQTVEAIKLATKQGCPIVVAINKCDLEGANPDKVHKELLTHGIATEEYGGEVLAVAVSAKTGLNMEELRQTIDLSAELLDLSCSATRPAEAVVVETTMSKSGCSLNMIVTSGSLKHGCWAVCGAEAARVRAVTDEAGKRLKIAGPSQVVSVQGFKSPELHTEHVQVFDSEGAAKQVAMQRAEHGEYDIEDQVKQETAQVSQKYNQSKRTAGMRFRQRTPGPVLERIDHAHTVKVLVKADVKGALDAFLEYVHLLPQEQVRLFVVKSGIGPVTDKDVETAAKLGASIFAYNLSINKSVDSLARNRKVSVVADKIIYNLMDALAASMQAVMPSVPNPVVVGTAKVLEMFTLNSKGNRKFTSAGCTVSSGVLYKKLQRGSEASELVYRVRRGEDEDEVVLFQGEVDNLFHFKDAVDQVKAGSECSLTLSGFDRFHKGDIVECVEIFQQQEKYDDSTARVPQHDYLDDI
eukprot:CAMPEP_0175175744 /NCGR_PEP_ID=MMETSP0087-20121206/33378_1 /TAXON_ID=136419 /ORGANISM="Unknown Unknown, Strain D1" /LENGTH=1103 /DNA_ID=CAMNT_0016467399 /DNA_START=57 /DNA_END=3368 /DNA_ORIENTATION=+